MKNIENHIGEPVCIMPTSPLEAAPGVYEIRILLDTVKDGNDGVTAILGDGIRVSDVNSIHPKVSSTLFDGIRYSYPAHCVLSVAPKPVSELLVNMVKYKDFYVSGQLI